jgi:membrane peptidoglycan carboxypeptidase
MNRPVIRFPLRTTSTVSLWKWLKWSLAAAFLVALVIVVRFVQIEIQTSRLQARYLSELGRDVAFTLADGASNSIRFPASGPYDVRLGYALEPSFEERLTARGFAVASQARDSARMLALADDGLFLPYDEKDQAGLLLRDARGTQLFSARYPNRVYDSFDAIPPVMVNALLFIEDRYLLDASQPNRNPAMDWGRFGRAVFDQGMRVVDRHQPTPGGSTLATQIEKFRHSPGGRTATPPEKLRQIASASVRAYLDGPQTLPARKQIVVRYLNSVPLAAKPGIGEINGIGDGLAAWYGRDFDEVNRVLNAPPSAETLDAQALAFKQALSLMIAQRAPSRFLRSGNLELDSLTDSYLRLLAASGIISTSLRDSALAVRLELDRTPVVHAPVSFVTRKAVTALRAHLLATLGVSNVYDLDRLDLSATATLDNRVQEAVSERLASAATREGAQAAGLYGFEMLRPQDDPSKIAYSFTLFERRDGANLMRVQTDSVNQPFDINQGARLNLGSTAKLRTLITYLQIVSTLHARYASMSVAQLHDVKPDKQDLLTRWALDYLSHASDRSLSAMLDAAVERKYSASPGETFYTGGGAQTFNNFEASDNSRILTVHRAFQHSVNLVFVRLMRDIVHYEMVQAAGPTSQWLDDPATRRAYLTHFADQESRVYMHRFYARYRGKTPDTALATLLSGVRKSPPKVATVLRSVAPDEPQAWFDAQMRAALKRTPAAGLSSDDLSKLYMKYGIGKFDLNDRGYIASVHPLELWTVNYLRDHPLATEIQLQDASRAVRFTAYSWLFKTRYHATQDRRIKRMVELQAFAEIGKSWRAQGYPFATITPSYAAAIGASGDRPVALAQLIGTIANGGKTLPVQTFSELEFGKGTPYETHFTRAATTPRTALSPEIVDVVHGLLRDVVLGGTAKRLAAGMTFPDGQTLDVYGKTGTGDQRFNVFARGARLIESRKVNRSATFVFVIGDRFFGTLTANVHEPYAARYAYTSALSVQLLKSLAPALQALLRDDKESVLQSSTAPRE